MPELSEANVLLARSGGTVARARSECARSARLQQETLTVVREACLARKTAADDRERMLLNREALFVVLGAVDGQPAEARWARGHGLMCPDELLARAAAVVALGETFYTSDGGPEVVASLDSPLPAVLTVMRAFSRVKCVKLHRNMANGI